MNKFLKPLLYSNKFKRIMYEIELNKEILPDGVGIETSSYCNRKCGYCPNSNVKRQQGDMEENIFYKIIDELAEIKFTGLVSPEFFNEPLLDKRLLDFIKYTRLRLPKSEILLFTNGDYLNFEMFSALIDAGVTKFRVSEHSSTQGETIKNTLQKAQTTGLIQYIDYVVFHNNPRLLMNRGGLVNVPVLNKRPWCNYVNNMAINWKGDATICCQDYLGEYIFGSIKHESVVDIWNKPFYKETRTKVSCGLFELEICKRCKGVRS